jgi:quercetin dioxygenase-like cupin family protein
LSEIRVELGDGPTPLNETVDFQEGGVVSRVLLRTGSGSLTAFAFDAGTGLDEHSSPQTAVIEVLSGRAVVTVDGAEHVVEEGQIIHLPAGIPHAVRAAERFRMLLTLLR